MLGAVWGIRGLGVSRVYRGLAGSLGTQRPERYRGNQFELGILGV